MNANVLALCEMSVATDNKILLDFVEGKKLSRQHKNGHWAYRPFCNWVEIQITQIIINLYIYLGGIRIGLKQIIYF